MGVSVTMEWGPGRRAPERPPCAGAWSVLRKLYLALRAWAPPWSADRLQVALDAGGHLEIGFRPQYIVARP